MACGSQREGPISGLSAENGGGVAIAYVNVGTGRHLLGGGSGMVGLRG